MGRDAQQVPRAGTGGADVQLPVTLVIAVRDEEHTLPALLSDIGRQVAGPAEVVLVDGGSRDGTVRVAAAEAIRDPRYVVLEADGGATPGRGRNLGIAVARHEWIALTDAGVRLEPDWLAELWRVHCRTPEAGVVYGNFEFDTRSFFEDCAAVAYGTPKRTIAAGRVRRPAVVSCLAHRSTVDAVSGFPDLRAGEDMIFAQRVEDSGVPIAWAPDATVWWRLRPDFRSTFERFRLYSYHNTLAGQQAHWHHRMARSYVPVAAGIVLSGVHSRRWLLVSGGTLAARVAVRLRRHDEGRGWTWWVRPDRAGLVAALLVANDAATALGWWQASRTLSSRSAGVRSRPSEGGGGD